MRYINKQIEKNRKSQMEMLGVAAIVVIVVIGMFYVLFSKPKSVDTKQDVLDAQLSQSMLNAVLQSDTECGNEMGRVIEDCYVRNSLCKNSCEYVKQKIVEIFEGSIDKWGKPYRFYTERHGEKKILIEKDCTQFSEKASTGLALLNFKRDTIVVALELCKI